MVYLFYFLGAAVLAGLFTPLFRSLATRVGAIDIPRPPRNLHTTPTPKLGGLPLFLSFGLLLLLYILLGRGINYQVIPLRFFEAIFLGSAVVMVGGFLDDKYDLPPKLLWIFPALAAFVVVQSGIGVGIVTISNPLSPAHPFNLHFHILGLKASGLFAWIWLIGMMFTTKFLDGIDGLAAGVSGIASLALFFLSLTQSVNQPMTATMAIILTGAMAGYLIYAFHPASIFLGEGGSIFLGFMLGTLSIILGGKIATAFLVMGIPILDVAWVIVRRLWYGRSPFKGDRLHLHFKLLDLGYSQRQTVLILYALSAMFGFTAVFLQSLGKLIALGVLFFVMLAFIITLVAAYKRKHPHQPVLPVDG